MESLRPARRKAWRAQTFQVDVVWGATGPPPPGVPVRVIEDIFGESQVVSAAYEPLGVVVSLLGSAKAGLLKADVTASGQLEVRYLGPENLT